MKQENLVRKLNLVLPSFILNIIFVNHYYVKKFTKFVVSQLNKGDKILDAGAGDSPYKKYFSDFRYHACDLKVGDDSCNYSGLDFECNLERIPVQSNSYDAIICYNVLEHVPYPNKVIAEFNRILKNNGKLFMVVAQEWKVHQAPHNYFNFTKYGLNLLLNDGGFKVNYIKEGGGYFHYMSTRISESTSIYFHYMKGIFSSMLLFPFLILHGLIFSIIFPVLLFPLDFLDRERTHTSNIFAYASKI